MLWVSFALLLYSVVSSDVPEQKKATRDYVQVSSSWDRSGEFEPEEQHTGRYILVRSVAEQVNKLGQLTQPAALSPKRDVLTQGVCWVCLQRNSRLISFLQILQLGAITNRTVVTIGPFDKVCRRMGRVWQTPLLLLLYDATAIVHVERSHLSLRE